MNGDSTTESIRNETTPLLHRAESGSSIQSIHKLPGMKIRSHLIHANGSISDCTSKEALKGARSGKDHYWIDIDADHRDVHELKGWLSKINSLPKFFQSFLSEESSTWTSQVVVCQQNACKSSLAVIRFLPRNNSQEVAHLAALNLQNLLLTFTSSPRDETGDLYDKLHFYMGNEHILYPTSSGALLAWLRFHIEQTAAATRILRTSVLDMDEAMDRNITSVSLQEIIEAKDDLLRLLSVAEEQVECLESLSGAAPDIDTLDFSTLQGALSVLMARAGGTERMALRLEKHITDLRQRHEGHQQERINRRLAILTVISAVFLPLTLVTGIWGMNFEYMPELKNREAYPLALFAMFMTATTMICCFWRQGWFQ